MSFEIATSLRPQTLTRLEQLEAFEAEWLELWKTCPAATPFQSPAWLIPWWKHFGVGQLRCLAIRNENQLVGFAPIFIYQSSPSAPRQVLLIGTGISDYLDILAQPGFETAVANALIEFLEEQRGDWNVCDFQELKSDSILLSALCAREIFQLETQSLCPILALPDSIEQLGEIIPKHTLEKLSYYRRRIAKAGSMQIECASENTFSECFDALVRLHGQRWKSRGETGVLNPVADFHRDAAARLLSLGVLRLYALRLDRRIIGTLYSFAHRQCVYFYLNGFAPEFSRFSPGLLLIGHAIEEAVRNGFKIFDFLRGQEPYKYTWGAVDFASQRLVWKCGN